MNYATIHASPATSEASDLRPEFGTLVSGCGVFELGTRAKFSLTGKDRVRWLNGMITNKVRDLPEGHGIYAFVLNPQGHILGDLYAYNRGEWLLIEIDHAQTEKLLGIFRKYIIMDKVEIVDLSEKLTAIGIAGPKALDVLRAAGADCQNLEPMQFVEVTWRGSPITITHGDNPAVQSYEIGLAPEQLASVRDALIRADAVPVSPAAVELLRVASGVPRYGQDIRERDLPQETEQLRALHFSKGCYIGQEIVERIRSRAILHRTFVGFEVEGVPPPQGTKVRVNDKNAGEMTSIARVPFPSGQRTLALGYAHPEIAVPGTKVQIDSQSATVQALPFRSGS